ncbi:iron dicitrate transport regulator FecR [Ectopseudomonas composti]|uniref:Iron dicitrate transport regulator FecR n=1 Tax=Ectopseudomonas composti TaxID=658457 RepID=A0ABN0SB03_9GAMM|nr:FecR family protein [Pseudomonas composti]EZH79738.1 iron dicitrate transport regulator FecR [Pseudomonas composti]
MKDDALQPVVEQAIEWMVRLRSGRTDAATEAAFRDWLAAAPDHAQTWQELQRRLGAPYDLVRSAPDTLREPLLLRTHGRRDVLRGLVGLGLFGGGLWLASRSDHGQALLADLRTGTAERRELTLADGSRLSLNAGSAVNLDFSPGQRLLYLHQGSLVIQVTADATRPLVVRTAQGDARALGTRFLVERHNDSTRVVVLEHAVRVSLATGEQLDLQEGQSADLHRTHIEHLDGDQRYRADWQQGRLSVLDEPLQTVIDALRPYHRGLLRVAPEVRGLRVQGVFPLDDNERTFNALAETLPVKIEHYGPWLTLIVPRG